MKGPTHSAQKSLPCYSMLKFALENQDSAHLPSPSFVVVRLSVMLCLDTVRELGIAAGQVFNAGFDEVWIR